MRNVNFQEYLQLSQYFDGGQTGFQLDQVVINVVLLLIMTILLGALYVQSSYSLSNRRRLAVMFPVLGLTTMMIISIIQSSLALSLGLVGALSIIRFRAAIKEPEELIYIFLVVSLGLGFGAQQRAVTLFFFVVITALLAVRMALQGRLSWLHPLQQERLFLDIRLPGRDTSDDTTENTLDTTWLTELLAEVCNEVRLQRVDDGAQHQQWLYEIGLRNMEDVEYLRAELVEKYPAAELSLVQHESMFG